MSIPRTPDSQEIRARYAVSAVFLVFGVLVGSWLPHIPDVKRQLGCSDAALGQALLCSGLGAVISMQTVGSLIHRFGSKNVSVAGGVVACCLVPSLMLQTSLFGLAANLFILGFGYGVLDVGMNSHAVEVQALHTKPILAGIHGSFSFGGIVGGLSAALAVRCAVSPLLHLAITSATLLALLAVSRPFLLPSSADKNSEGPKFIFPSGVLLTLGVLCACAFVLEGGVLDWSALFVRESLHANAAFGGVVTGLCSGAMACGRFLGDPIAHRLGNRSMISFGATLCIVGVVGAAIVPSVWACIALFSVACLGLANMVPVIFNEAGRASSVPTGVGVAAITTCGYGGFLLGPPIIGMVGSKVSLSAAMAGLSILGVILIVGSRKFSTQTA